MTDDKYSVDERLGCIAVVETKKVASPGLGHDYPGVVWYRHGHTDTTGAWRIRYVHHLAAHRVCERLNVDAKLVARLADAERLAEAEHALGRTEGSIYG